MTEQPHTDPGLGHQAGGQGGHSWLMIACCIPMIVIAVALVATGAASPGFLFVVVMCTAMMAMMMRGMDHGGGASGEEADRSDRTGHER